MIHKNIPCPKCNRIWVWLEHATPENPICPEGHGCNVKVSEYTIKEMLERVIKRLDDIDMKINRIQPTVPITPIVRSNSTVCAKCGIDWKGAMGYVCHYSDCPVQFKVTSISHMGEPAWQSYNSSTSIEPFDIESLDPAERSWYYDGDGTKRSK